VIHLTCYFRIMRGLFEEIGIEVTPQNKYEIDLRIHKLVGVDYKDCPSAGREVKKRMVEDRAAFAASLQAALSDLRT
jgi:hypothetical protein